MTSAQICITIVTRNSDRYIRRCLDALLEQDIPLEIVVFDNASTDQTRDTLASFGSRIHVIVSETNIGFAEAHNRAMAAGSAPWVLTLNPDVLVHPGFLRTLVEAGDSDPQAGSVCGKLLSIGPGFEPLPDRHIDSTGMYFTPAMRHFDRGWRQPDNRRFDRMEYVFGASAAAALYRREMIEDVAVDGHFFDPDFFVYREDADVAWRALLLGWRCLYVPLATAWHVRTVTPINRRDVPAAVNMHSVKNRFLMRIKNATPGLYRAFWLPMTVRDIVVLGGSLLWEPTSLAAFYHVLRCLPRALRGRRDIMSRRRIDDAALVKWFDTEPATAPVPARQAIDAA